MRNKLKGPSKKVRLGLLLSAGIPFTAAAECPKENPVQVAATLGPEQSAGEARSILVKDGDILRPLYYSVSAGRAIFEGDIVIGDAEALEAEAKKGPIAVAPYNADVDLRQSRGLVFKKVLGGSAKWPDATIPYQIEADTPNVPDVERAIATWSTVGVKFVPRTAANAGTYRNYVSFQKGKDSRACFSQTMGMLGGEQYVQLVPGCGYGQILHEIGHVIGLQHEQNRSDRQNFVEIHFENIWPQFVYAFIQRPQDEQDVGSYDADSISHYERNAFSCNGEPTIVSKSNAAIGQRDHLSEGDRAVVRKIFGLH